MTPAQKAYAQGVIDGNAHACGAIAAMLRRKAEILRATIVQLGEQTPGDMMDYAVIEQMHSLAASIERGEHDRRDILNMEKKHDSVTG